MANRIRWTRCFSMVGQCLKHRKSKARAPSVSMRQCNGNRVFSVWTLRDCWVQRQRVISACVCCLRWVSISNRWHAINRYALLFVLIDIYYFCSLLIQYLLLLVQCLCLQILAISDIVVYRTRSERLHSDMYEFLGTASTAFCKHFTQALHTMGKGSILGPAVIIFHETHYTKPLESCK